MSTKLWRLSASSNSFSFCFCRGPEDLPPANKESFRGRRRLVLAAMIALVWSRQWRYFRKNPHALLHKCIGTHSSSPPPPSVPPHPLTLTPSTSSPTHLAARKSSTPLVEWSKHLDWPMSTLRSANTATHSLSSCLCAFCALSVRARATLAFTLGC